MKKELCIKEGVTILKIVIGCFLYALSVVLFIDPAQIIPGSVTGIGVVVKALTGFPIGTLSIIINVPLVIIGTIILGKRLLIYTGITVLLSSLMIDWLTFLKPFTEDLLLASVFGGVIMGIGLGMILDAGGTTGGTTVVGRLVLKKFPHIPMGTILLIGDFIIITVGSLLLKDWDLLLYSIIDLYICVVALDKVMYGFKINSFAEIRTENQIEVEIALSKAGFKNVRVEKNCRIVVICRKKEVSKIQHIVLAIDSRASCTAYDIDYSFGNLYKGYVEE
ncbi:MAG TPA: YitT family protein [Candidatus Anaerostipes excrementavium]|uniref:YitT family protein n=1 Tax=Candidatus Anaerostipes excrementavium TaxID=2838463 RepID=A0A9D2B948_9FIRM|nr:YitT family protein [uncultured Anaerostipes sp.]HIX66779.1 YitT family protein [Candidatus Anaerostipes excrementavium]